MGLSGRKAKQRIGHDPRNLSWADDAARFGSSYLSKFGWDASKGLGAGGEGRLSHIKVSHKLDMLGIGASHQRDPNGIAWKQNRDFENLLKRLNGGEEEVKPKIDGFVGPSTIADNAEGKNDMVEEERPRPKDGKRKRSAETAAPTEKEDVKKRKIIPTSETAIEQPSPKAPPSLPRHRSHRARAIAAKNIASKHSSHISEILGISPSPSAGTPSAPSGSVTPLVSGDDSLTETEADDKITTSRKSIFDYFSEKLKSRSTSSASVAQANTSRDSGPEGSRYGDDDLLTPRAGLGQRRLQSESCLRNMFSIAGDSEVIDVTTSSSSKPPCPPAMDDKDTHEQIPAATLDGGKEKKRKKKKTESDDVPEDTKTSKKKKKGHGAPDDSKTSEKSEKKKRKKTKESEES